jgi:hypothetical protein
MLEPCREYQRLAEEHFAATSDLLAASDRLATLAGAGNQEAFSKAEDQCRELLRRCIDLRECLDMHRQVHGCVATAKQAGR